MIMVTTKNNFSGASFDYANKKNTCTASGEYRCENDKVASININGSLTKGEKSYPFWANVDASGNVNISGVPADAIAEVGTEVAAIVSEIEAIITPANAE